ncbi:MAG: HGGxSTG domain-containing protein [Pseudomonadota bacterium]
MPVDDVSDTISSDLAGLSLRRAMKIMNKPEKKPRKPRAQARSDQPRCGARTRTGAPCKRKPVAGKRRRPNHGGLSTGPKTPEGWERMREGYRRWVEKRRREKEAKHE